MSNRGEGLDEVGYPFPCNSNSDRLLRSSRHQNTCSSCGRVNSGSSRETFTVLDVPAAAGSNWSSLLFAARRNQFKIILLTIALIVLSLNIVQQITSGADLHHSQRRQPIDF